MKAAEVSRQSWWRNFLAWWHGLFGPEPEAASRPDEVEETDEHPATSALSMATGGLQLRVGVVSTTGNVREHNEDNVYVPGRASLRNGPSLGPRRPANEVPPTDEFPAQGPPDLFIVADGMGGQLAGEKASQMAVEDIPRELQKRLGPEDDDKAILRALREAVARANEEILARSHLETEFANMGTTVVLALFRNARAYVAGIGDSRAYRLRDDKLDQLTKDHSLANALGEAGTIRPEEVETHKFKHVLYLYLGSKDARDGPEEIRVVDVRPGDQFLLASDGLTGVVRDETIAEVLRAAGDPQRAAEALVRRALDNLSKDNITCVVIQVLPGA
jgi:serine/threonine protein phosphatase PrpC